MRSIILMTVLPICATCFAQGAFVRVIDDFDSGELKGWNSSMSPEYYKGGTGQKGLQVIDDPERGKVLQANIRYVDEKASEPAFITRQLDFTPEKLSVLECRFWAKLTGAGIAAEGGFKVRLRTEETAFMDYDVAEALGRPFPAGEWVRVVLNTGIDSKTRNVWGSLFGTIKQLTFRLDDIDERNADFNLLVDDVEFLLQSPPAQETYEPTVTSRAHDGKTRVLFLKHRAAGYYGIEQAIRAAIPGTEVDTFFYRGFHFEFFGFPQTREQVLAYDTIIMLGVDPIMMTWEQCAWIADAVASGSHLLLFGGPVTLTHAKDFKSPLRSVLPVTFEAGAASPTLNTPPTPGPVHFLNEGLDPAGLGLVAAVHDITPVDGAQVPWTAKGRPLIITGAVGQGRSTVVNTWPNVTQSPTGDFFTSPLSDDLMVKLLRYALGDTQGPAITHLELPLMVSYGGEARLMARASEELSLSGDCPIVREGAEGDAQVFRLALPASQATETRHVFRLQTAVRDGRQDTRDFEITVRNPLKLAIAWTRAKYTFAPGSPVSFDVNMSRRDLPEVSAGPRTLVTYGSGKYPVSIDNFTDAWVYEPGGSRVIHDQAGNEEVKVSGGEGLLPRWEVSGYALCARPGENVHFGESDRILKVTRAVQTQSDGGVFIDSQYEFTQDMKVQRLPLTISLPVSNFAGLKYRAEQKEGVREGVFPTDSTRGTLLDGHGLKLTIETPEGPITIARAESDLRVWMRDLRQYDMTQYRLEVEAPFVESEARAGEKYAIQLSISGPVPGASPEMQRLQDAPQIRAELVDPRSGYVWPVPAVGEGAGTHFEGSLPNLASGEYVMRVVATSEGETLCTTSAPCHVVDPLDRTDFYPIMSIVGIDGDGHRLDDDGVMARVDDLIAHGFNTAAIMGTPNFTSGTPANAARLKGVAESYAQRRGMATTYEYTNFTDLRSDKAPGVCVFDPTYHDSLKGRLDWQIDVGNRTPRLLSAKVIDEPTISPGVLANISPEGKAAFRDAYGLEYSPELFSSSDPYTRWACADFLGDYLAKGYETSARIMEDLHARFDLLLTYMATGHGYGRALSGQQDSLDWTRHVKWADFDVYPYFYPASQRIRMIQAGFAMTHMRDVSRARGVPWGFYVELDDRNWPFQKNPKEASAECAYTAVARGADYLNSFINTVAGTGTQSRPERWEACGEAMRAIRRLGPMLTHMKQVRAGVAILFPNTQQAIGNGYPTPQYALAAIQGGHGECDVYNEEVAVETGEIPYRCLFLFKTTYIHEDMVPLLTDWLQKGGVLVTDGLPTKTHRGEEIDWGFELAPGAREGNGVVDWHTARVGEGQVVLLQTDIDQAYKDLVEAKTPAPAACKGFRESLAMLLELRLPPPPVWVSYTENSESVDLVEAGLRGGDDGYLLTVVNHHPQTERVEVLWRVPRGTWLVDAVSMQELTPRLVDPGAVLELDVPGRGARIIAAYPSKPAALGLKAETEQVAPGGELAYSLTVTDAQGNPVPGAVLVEVRVTDAEGGAIARYGAPLAALDGVRQVRVPVALNAAAGTYIISARVPFAGLTASARFEVK